MDGQDVILDIQWLRGTLEFSLKVINITDSVGTDETCFTKLQIISLSWETRMLSPQTLQLLSPGLSLQYQPWGTKLSVYIRTYSHRSDTACLYIVLLLSYYIVTCLEYFDWTLLCMLLQASLVDDFSF